MAVITKRKVLDLGNSRAITVPKGTVVGSVATVAVDRLLLADLRGIVSEAELLELLEILEPRMWVKKEGP